jgi:hypothetical protein
MKIDGMKVVDAKRKFSVVIRRGDVASADKKAPATCAAAKALSRLPKVSEARVHLSRTYLQIGNRWVRYRTPLALRAEIIAFDRGGTFDAGVYKLETIHDDARLGKRRKRYPETGRKPTAGNRGKNHRMTGVRPHAPGKGDN